ncbi:MAG: glutathione S-transferase N-terminal domain-containing protein [Xanthomonadaceae bacterium]|jgi:GST-like protein|nr:glutathione S-transferase N-terminal domain-containing protein [Xanthomonadaceae bacterium]
MIDLYYWPTPNGHKITLFLEEAGLPYAVKPVDIGAGDQFKPGFLAISPNNRMPAIVDRAPADGGAPISVFESGAILLYLAEKCGKFLDRDPRQRIATLEWLFWQVGGLGPMLGQNHHFNQYAPEKIPYAIERYVRESHRLYGVLDQRLRDREFLIDSGYGIADMASYPWTVCYARQNIDIDEFPHVKRWMRVIAERPATQRAYALTAQTNPNADKPLNEEERKHLFGQSAPSR